MLIATAAVTLIPLAVIWDLRSLGAVFSPWVCFPLAIAVSLAVTAAGSAYWKRRRPASELLFSELMAWSWLRRRRAERTIRDTDELLKNAGKLSTAQRTQLLRQLAGSLEAQDPYTIGHSHRVARHAAMVARKLGLSDEQARKVRAAAAIHDVGKLHIPPEVLNKPGRLTDAEYELVKVHANEGAQLVSGLGDDQLTEIVRHHHERLDGSGYPAGLAGEQIPLGARIVAVTDTFDAITSARPYRPARAHKQALDILREESGRQLDRRVVDAFIACYAGKRAIAAWAMLSSLPQTVLAAVGSGATRSAQTRISPRSAASSTAAMAAIAGLALAAPIGSHHDRRRHPPSPAAAFAAMPILHQSAVNAAHRTRTISRPAHSSPFSLVTSAPASRPPAPAHRPLPPAQRQRAQRTPQTHRIAPTPVTPTPPAPVTTTPVLTTTSSTATPPPTTTRTATPPPTATTTLTSVNSTTTTTTTIDITTSPPVDDPCKDGGYVVRGYSNQGQCESAIKGHHGRQRD